MRATIARSIRRLRDGSLTAELRAFVRASSTILAPAAPITVSTEARTALRLLPRCLRCRADGDGDPRVVCGALGARPQCGGDGGERRASAGAARRSDW